MAVYILRHEKGSVDMAKAILIMEMPKWCPLKEFPEEDNRIRKK